MKKLLLALLTLLTVAGYSQTIGHLRYDSVKIYKVGGNSNLIIENATRDTIGPLFNYGNGRTRFESIRAVPGGIKVGGDTIIVNTSCEDGVVFGRTVSWEGGFRFHVQEGRVQIGCQLYDLDSVTLTLDSADADDRFDVIYDDVDGAHVLQGVPGDPAAVPQVEGGQIHLTSILIENGATNPSVSSVNVYFENDATITPSGTTAVGNATTAPFAGSFHIRISSVNNGDFVDIIKPSGTWDISAQTSLVIHLKPLAVVPQGFNIRASLWNGPSTGSQTTTDVTLNYNKFNTGSYMAIAIPMSALAPQNTNVDRVRLKFNSNNAAVFMGFDFDNVFFQAGVSQPGNNGTGQFTLNLPAFLSPSPLTILTNNSTHTITANGTSSQYVRGDGTLATFNALNAVGTFNTQTASNNGAEISGTSIFFHPVSNLVNGMVTPTMKEKWDSIYYAENMSSVGDSIMVSLAVDRIGFKSIHFTNTYGITDSTIRIDTTGGTSLVAGEGIAISGDSIHLGGRLATNALLQQTRVVNTNRKGLYFSNGTLISNDGGPVWQFTDRPFSPFQFHSADTLTTSNVDPPTAAMPLSGLFARRTLYYNSSALTTQKIYGHYLGLTYNWIDSFKLFTAGGDYNVGTIVEARYEPRGTGPQRLGNTSAGNNSLPYFGAPTFLSNTILVNTSGTNTIHTYGWLTGISSYLVAGALDTVERFSFYQTNNFLQATTRVKKYYGIDFQHNLNTANADSSFGIWDQYGYRHYIRGKTVFGTSPGTAHAWASSDQLKVIGNFNLTDSMHLGKASLIGDSTGMDFVLRRRTDGALFRIRADLMTFLSGGSGDKFGKDDVLAAENRLFDTDGFSFGVIGDGDKKIESTTTTGYVNTIRTDEAENLTLKSVLGGNFSGISLLGDLITFSSNVGNYSFTNMNDQPTFTKVVVYDASSSSIGTQDISGLGGGTQGLDDVLAVGQALTADRTTPTSAFNWTIDGSNNIATFKVTNSSAGGAYAIIAEGSTDNGGVSGSSVDFYGGDFQSTNLTGLNAGSQVGYGAQISSVSGIGAQISVNPASTNTVIPIAQFTRATTGTGANGLGASLDFYLENASGASVKATQIITKYTDATNGSEDTEFELWGMVAGVLTKFQTIGSGGIGGGLTQEQSEDFTGAMFATDNGDIDFTYNDATPDIGAQIKAGAVGFSEMQAITDNRLLGAQGGTAVEEISVSSPLTLSSNALGIQNAAADGSTKGAASFTAADFDASSGNISLDYVNMQPASGSQNGIVNQSSQSFAGVKTFNSGLVSTGFATLNGGLSTNSTAGNGNLYATGGIIANRSTTANFLPLSAAGAGARVFVNGTTNYTMTASDAFGSVIIGTTGGVTEAGSGTHPIVASLVVRPLTITNAAGATDIAAGVYIEGPATGITPATASYGLWLDAGNARLDGNVLIGGTAAATSATTSLHLFNGTVPSASITDGVLLYSEDVTSSAELKVRDEAGNITTLSPHNFTGIPGGRSEDMAWSFYSQKDGKYINVDMLKLVRLVEKLTGEKLVYIGEVKNK